MKKTSDLVQSCAFMTCLTFIGGFIDAYTYIIRGGVFANNQTANIAKFGIELMNMNWQSAMNCFYPMLACVAGAFCAEFVKTRSFTGHKQKWQQYILLIELTALLIAGFIPTSVSHNLVNISLSFFTAWQLSAFRTMEGWVLNSTISTGNLRSVGQYWYQSLFVERKWEFTAKTIRFTVAVLAFAIGALIGTLCCKVMQEKAIWICCVVLAGLFFVHRQSTLLEEKAPQSNVKKLSSL